MIKFGMWKTKEEKNSVFTRVYFGKVWTPFVVKSKKPKVVKTATNKSNTVNKTKRGRKPNK